MFPMKTLKTLSPMPLAGSAHATRLTLLALVAGALAGCNTLPASQAAADEAPVITGSAPRRNETPMDPALACLRQAMLAGQARVASVTVGDVKDYTGKYSQTEGNAITQGGSLMIYSALGKLGNAIRLHERFDTRIAELELAYADRRQLGDGQLHTVEAGKPQVPWVPYFGGSILRTDYYIVGGITEVNYNIASRGGELNVASVGARQRTFTMNVGVDLRIIDTRSLQVLKTVSLQKQITGEEVGVGVFRFFGRELIDLNLGGKSQEPLQLGVRTTIEHGVVELMAAVSGLAPQPCVDLALAGSATPEALSQAVASTAAALVKPTASVAPAAPAPLAVAVPNNAPAATPASAGNGASGALAAAVAVGFEPNSPALDGVARSALAAVIKATQGGAGATLNLLTRDAENLPTAQRQQLAQARVNAVTEALVDQGLAANRIRVDWLPDASAPIERQGAGMQLVARLSVLSAGAAAGAAAPAAGASDLKEKATNSGGVVR
jgi:curli biogenesis system outer membrane secretion channel CsgG